MICSSRRSIQAQRYHRKLMRQKINKKLDHVITSLDAITAANVSDLMRNRPTTTSYTHLRQRLVYVYELSDRERADRPLDIGHLGDQKPLELANKMLNMLEDRCKFSRNLPLSSGGTEKSARLLHHQNLNCVSSWSRPTLFIFRHNGWKRDGDGCFTKYRDAIRNSCCFRQSMT